MRPQDYDRLFDRFRHNDDSEALARLFDLLAPDLYRVAGHLEKKPGGAEDLVQATFLTAIEKRMSYRAEGKFFAWLAGILANQYRHQLDKDRRTIDLDRLRAGGPPEESRDVRSDAERDELASELERAIDSMPEPYQGVLKLKLTEGLEPEVIAERLDRRPGTVRSQLHRGMAMLRKLLPAGLATLVFSVARPRTALGSVREAVLSGAHQAIGAPVGAAAATVVATDLKLLAGLATLLVCIAGPLAWWSLADPETDLTPPAATDSSLEASHEVGPEAARSGLEVGPRPASPRNVDEESPQEPDSEPDVPWKRSVPIQVQTLSKSATIESVRIGPIPEGLSANYLNRLPLTGLASEFSFSEPVEVESNRIVYLAPKELAGLVFIKKCAYGNLVALPGPRFTPAHQSLRAVWHPDPKIYLSELVTDSSSRAVEKLEAQLWTRDGVVTKPFTRRGDIFEFGESLPSVVDLRIRYVDGKNELLRWRFAWDAERRGTAYTPAEVAKTITMQAVDAFDDRIIGQWRVDTFTLSPGDRNVLRHSAERGSRREIGIAPRRGIVSAHAYIRASGYHPRVIHLQRRTTAALQSPWKIKLWPRAARSGRLLDASARPVPHAQVTLTAESFGARLMLAVTDDEGTLDFEVMAGQHQLAVTQINELKPGTTVTATIRLADGSVALAHGLELDAVMRGGDIRLSEKRRDVSLRVLDAKGEVIPRAQVRYRVPSPHDDRIWSRANTQGMTDDQGIVVLDRAFSSEIVVTVSTKKTMSVTRRVSLDQKAPIDFRLPEMGEIRGAIEGIETFGKKRVTLTLTEETENQGRADRDYVVLRVDEEGRFSTHAPMGFRYTLRVRSFDKRRGAIIRFPQDKFEGIEPGDPELLISALACVQVPFEIVGADTPKPLRQVRVRSSKDQNQKLSAWESRTQGLGGSWEGRRKSLTLPLGRSDVTITAPGYRTIRRSVVVSEEMQPVEVVLEPGPRIVAQARPGARIMYRLVTLSDVEWPESWMKTARQWNGYSKSATTDKSGEVSPTRLAPGRYEVLVNRKVVTEIDVDDDLDLGFIGPE